MPKEVFIPFQPEFEQSMLTGDKTATTRTRRFGSPGDWFKQFGAIFILTEVYALPLSRAVYCHYPGQSTATIRRKASAPPMRFEISGTSYTHMSSMRKDQVEGFSFIVLA